MFDYTVPKLNSENFIKGIEKDGVQTRPIISGNFLKQPSIKKYKLNKNFKLKNSDYINDHGLFIGLPTKLMTKVTVKKLVKVFEKNI